LESNAAVVAKVPMSGQRATRDRADMTAYDLLRIAHLGAGGVAFLVAPIALATRKGSDRHPWAGRVYLLPMSFAAASAVVLAAERHNVAFVFIGLFSLYLGLSGYRALQFKRTYVARSADRGVAGVALAFFAIMLAYGVLQLGVSTGRAVPLLAFGAVGATLAIGDWRRLRADRAPEDWVFGHMRGMVASYIAAWSAFLVINLGGLALPVRILLAPAVGIPALLVWGRVWRSRLRSAPLSRWADVSD
jgi:uncharacterized membrane protein